MTSHNHGASQRHATLAAARRANAHSVLQTTNARTAASGFHGRARGRVPSMPGTGTSHDMLARRAAAHPDREAIVDHRHRVTYGALLERVDRTAAALQSLGL